MRFTDRIGEVASHPLAASTSFRITGARNVALETVKRGEDDKVGEDKTVILRLYEHYGGHARATLKM